MDLQKIAEIEREALAGLVEIEVGLASGQLSAEDVRGYVTRMKALAEYPKLHPIECYQPIRRTRAGMPHQYDFHTSPKTGRGAFGGNQSGKTQCGSFEAGFRFTNQWPDWYPVDLRLTRQNIGRIVVKDYPHSVEEVIKPALEKCIPKRFIKNIRTNNKGYLIKMESTTGSKFDIVTHDTDVEALEGWQGDWAWFDEPPPRSHFVATLRGLVRRSGRFWITCTPLAEPWMYDEIYTNPQYFSITIDIRDNPYLRESGIKEFESRLTEDEKESRLHGRFMHLAGLVHKTFDPAIHIKPRCHIPPEWPRWMICDPHARRPFAFLWFAVDPFDRVWIYNEWPHGWFHEMRSSDKSLKDYVHIIREEEMNQPTYRRIIDGRAGKAPLVVGTQSGEHQDTLIDAFDDLGIHFEPSYITQRLNLADPGKIRIDEYLRVSPTTNEPQLIILDNCQNTIYAFQHSVWLPDTRDGRAQERPSEYAKDFIDLVRYGLMDDPRFLEVNPQADQPKWVERRQAELFGGSGFGGMTDY